MPLLLLHRYAIAAATLLVVSVGCVSDSNGKDKQLLMEFCAAFVSAIARGDAGWVIEHSAEAVHSECKPGSLVYDALFGADGMHRYANGGVFTDCSLTVAWVPDIAQPRAMVLFSASTETRHCSMEVAYNESIRRFNIERFSVAAGSAAP